MTIPMARRRMHRLWSLVQEPRHITITIAALVYSPGAAYGQPVVDLDGSGFVSWWVSAWNLAGV